MIVPGNPVRHFHSPIAVVATLSLFFCLTGAAATCCRAASRADAIVGTWVVAEKDAHIEIYRQGDGYFGKISWLREDDEKVHRGGSDASTQTPMPAQGGAPVRQGERRGDNKDGAKKATSYETPRKGLVIVRDFRFDGNAWKWGTLYDPTDGKSYRGVISLDGNDELHVRGFIGVSFFGRTTIWQRVR
ncbi:MAG: DUF2147 domain-containing protein [Syntrophorhabdales bacterium]|jgi:uncharacterized protein (DUF2147 family)